MRTMMRGKHGKKSRFPALAALALCAVLIVTFMPNLMFSANADTTEKQHITGFHKETVTVDSGMTEQAVLTLLNEQHKTIQADVKPTSNSSAETKSVEVQWERADYFNGNKRGDYNFVGELRDKDHYDLWTGSPSITVSVLTNDDNGSGSNSSDPSKDNSENQTESNSKLKYSTNVTKDAFSNSDIYTKYLQNMPEGAGLNMGVAGYFHVVAFETAKLTAHTNGNILAHELQASSNFGTNNLKQELSYIQECTSIVPSSVPRDDDVLVVGSKNTVGDTDNKSAFTINGKKIDRPKNIIQDKDTATNPYIDLNILKDAVLAGQGKLAAHTQNINTKAVNDGQQFVIQCDGTGTAYYNMTAQEFNKLRNQTSSGSLSIKGLDQDSKQALVINIDCKDENDINGPIGNLHT